ncbi:MAG: DUF4013 domain-containing protein [Oscillochloridaceae bacterium umkhey_bin13]
MDIGKAFSYVFEDEQWISSILICGLMIFIPIIGWLAIAGYGLEAARNVAQNNPRPLPKWNNFGEKISLGWNWLLISLFYALPVIILSTLFACIPAFAGMAGATGSDEVVGAMVAMSVSLMLCLMPILILLGLAIQVLIFPAALRYLQTGSLGAALQFREVIAMVRSDLSGWVVVLLLYLLASLVMQVGSIVVIGIIFTMPYGQAFFGHILGQKLAQMGMPRDYGTSYGPPSSVM